jgi:hypothetical protein
MLQILSDTALLTVSMREFKRFEFTGCIWRCDLMGQASYIMR